ncbi:MAG TPA: penicillin acylase family protein, partial [Actinomycetota bacterium]|nr:penicillin acylase family protein [Actinomycetota bacterium]
MTSRQPNRPRKIRLAALGIVTVVSLITPLAAGAHVAPGGYREGDESLVALNILPPGQGHHLNALEAPPAFAGMHPAHNTDQIAKYEGLIKAASTLNSSNLADWFTDASFGVKPGDVGRIYKPGYRHGLVVVRDLSKDVPHVYGTTRADTMFGAGYVSGEDRLFAMDALRHLGRGRLSELLGPSASNLASDRAVRLASDYDEAELEAMGQRLKVIDPVRGAIAEQDLLNYSAGINQFIHDAIRDPSKLPAIYPAIQQMPQLWKPTDSIAIAAYIGGVFSVGGGGQLRNAAFLKQLMDQGKTYAEARSIMEDFRFANDPEAPVSTSVAFPYNTGLGPVDLSSVALPDNP